MSSSDLMMMFYILIPPTLSTYTYQVFPSLLIIHVSHETTPYLCTPDGAWSPQRVRSSKFQGNVSLPKHGSTAKAVNVFHLLIPIGYMLHVKKWGSMRGRGGRENREEGYIYREMEYSCETEQ